MSTKGSEKWGREKAEKSNWINGNGFCKREISEKCFLTKANRKAKSPRSRLRRKSSKPARDCPMFRSRGVRFSRTCACGTCFFNYLHRKNLPSTQILDWFVYTNISRFPLTSCYSFSKPQSVIRFSIKLFIEFLAS